MTHMRSQKRMLWPLFFIFALLLTACNSTSTATKPSAITDTRSKTDMITAADACTATIGMPGSCVSPATLRKAYGIEPLNAKGYTGKGQTVVDIVSFGSPTLQQDMDVFDRTFALPPVNLQVIAPLTMPEQDPHHDKQGWGSETTLDVQIIHALAPDAKIVVLESPVAETEGTIGLPQFRQLEQYVIDHKLGNIVTHSWGASELTLTNSEGRAEIAQWDALLKTGTLTDKITYLSSSGDNGATDYSDLNGTQLGKVPTTSFVASSPWTTSVGGSQLNVINGQAQETAWSGSGGGFSRFYTTPDYQKTLPSETLQQFQNRRGVPDVAALADPSTGFPVYDNGSWALIGGTSASAPQWAAIVAIADQMAGRPLGFINPALYQIASSNAYHQDFNDITNGNNTNVTAGVKGYPAAIGWDPITGLGTPDAQNLIPALIAQDKN